MPTPDPFAEYVQRMQDRFANRSRASAPATARGPAKPSAGGQVLTEPGTEDYLGEKTGGINLTGASDIAAGSAGLPAPSAPGGMSGFAGGAGAPTGVSGGQGGPPDIAGMVQKLLGKVGQAPTDTSSGAEKPDLGTEQQSMGDWLQGLFGGPRVSDVTAGHTFDVPSGLGTEAGKPGLGADFVEPSGAIGAGGSTAGALAGMAIGPLLSYLSSMATSDASPEMRAAISGLVQALTPVATPAIMGALGASTAGAAAGGGLAGAGAGLAAAGPGLIASAPMAAMIIGTSINNMLEQSKLAGQLTDRFKGLQSSLPGHIANLQKAPQLLQQLEGVTDPKVAADIYKQVEQIQQDFQQSGIEDFLQRGETQVTGPAGQGGMTASFGQGPQIFQQLTPFMQAMDVARMRASDIAARAGQPIEGARPIYDYAFGLGSPQFSETARPGVSGQGQVSELIGKLFGTAGSGAYAWPAGSMTGTYDPAAEAGVAATPALTQFAGLPEGVNATVGDIERFFAPGGAGYSQVEGGTNTSKYTGTPYGIANREIYNALQGIQPGNYEQGLADVYGKYGGMAPGLDRWGFGAGGMGADPARTQLVQRALDAAGGGSAFPGGAFGPMGGMLSEEDRRRLGVR